MDRETLKLMLSHHMPDNYDRCLKIPFLGQDWRLCTRCAGLYTSFITGSILLLTAFSLPILTRNLVMVLSPLPAFLDWHLNQKGYYSGTNTSRFVTGMTLGLFHATFVKSIFVNWLNPLPYLTALFYLSAAVFLAKKV